MIGLFLVIFTRFRVRDRIKTVAPYVLIDRDIAYSLAPKEFDFDKYDTPKKDD